MRQFDYVDWKSKFVNENEGRRKKCRAAKCKQQELDFSQRLDNNSSRNN